MMRPVFGSITTTNLVSRDLNDFEIYPNPSSNIVNVKHTHPFTIRIFDLTGAIVYFENTISKSLSFTTSKLESGMYVVELFSNNQIFRKKLILH